MPVIPNFFVVGAPKAGTTSMDYYLSQHPDIFIPHRKEVHYFGSDLTKKEHWFFVLKEQAYLKLFEKGAGYKRVGESSVMYLFSKQAAKEIKAFSPSARIIIMLRNPVEMMYSQFSHLLWACYEEKKDFVTALEAEEQREKGLDIPTHAMLVEALFYRKQARLAEQIERYFDVFGRENVKIILFDDFKKNSALEYEKTLDFLGVGSHREVDFRIANRNKVVRSRFLMKKIFMPPKPVYRLLMLLPDKPRTLFLEKICVRLNTKMEPRQELDPALKKSLVHEYIPEVKKLSHLIGRDLGHWMQP